MYLAICYSSSKNQSMSDEELEHLIDKSIISNAKNEISGVLIEYQSNFLQYLEGPAVKVFELFHKIKLDQRHHSVLLIQEKEIPERIFPDWNMLFKNINASSISSKRKGKVFVEDELRKLMNQDNFWKNIDMIEYLSNLT